MNKRKYSSYQARKAESSAKFSLALAIIVGITIPILLAMSLGMDCRNSPYIPSSLCGFNSNIRKVIFVIIILGVILHLSSYFVNKSIKDTTPEDIAHQKEKLAGDLSIGGHICFIPIYVVIALVALRLAAEFSKNIY